MPLVFSYGSLQEERVQLATFGRRLAGRADALPGHARRELPVADARGRISTLILDDRAEARVDGTGFEFSAAELAAADIYEASDGYRRVAVTLASGLRAWTYVEVNAARDRIWFAGNPWPDGHAVTSFAWHARRVRDRLVFGFDLTTGEYDAEASYDSRPRHDDQTDWQSPITWSNYHCCTLSSERWHDGGFDVGPADEATPALLDGRSFVVDAPPPVDRERNAFYVYLLGHDAVAHHRITFRRIAQSDRFLIDWRGRIALAYAGETDYSHEFRAELHDKPFPTPSVVTHARSR